MRRYIRARGGRKARETEFAYFSLSALRDRASERELIVGGRGGGGLYPSQQQQPRRGRV